MIGRNALLGLLLLATTSGCDQRRGALASGPLDDRVVKELSTLRAGGSVAEWLGAHPADSFAVFSVGRVTENHQSWCARATLRETLPGGLPFLRHAYFYPPAPPKSLELPPDTAANLVQRECRLGAIWIESPVGDTSAGRQQAEGVRATLSRAYGQVKASPDSFYGRAMTDSQKRALEHLSGFESLQLGVSFFGSAGWRTIGRWEVDSITVVSAFDAGLGPSETRRVLALAYVPWSNLGTPSWENAAEGEDEPSADTSVTTAARRAGIDPRATAAVLAVAGARASDSVRLAALQTWIAAASPLDSARRAAALFVADAAAPVGFERKDSAAIGPYHALGYQYVYSELDGGYNYTHNLLEEVLQLDPDGTIGEMVRLYKLHKGFNLNGMCGGGGEAFRQVIGEGAALLSGAKEPKLQAELDFLIGDGYADIVALAAGEGGEYADTITYAFEAPQARRNAIAHYRAALSLERRSAKARASWLEAWRLIAGLPPTTTHFFCVYD